MYTIEPANLFHLKTEGPPEWEALPSRSRRCIRCLNWLPESDALQNGKGLLFEFFFGQLNTAKGKKRLLPQEAFAEAARQKIIRHKTQGLKNQLRLARVCQQKLQDFPALTRKEIARQLHMTTARLNQILDLLRTKPATPDGSPREE